MKVEVNNKEKIPQIDWDEVQLVISDNNEIVQISKDQTNKYGDGYFCGQEIQTGIHFRDWIKKSFKPFNGTITIQND
jgi:hypothetical protein